MGKNPIVSKMSTSKQGGAAPDAVAPLSENEFVMLCAYADGGLDEAILSLYYLPPHFKLRVLINAATVKLPFAGHEAVKNRISVTTESGMPLTASPFSEANAVVYSESTPVKSTSETPRVVISKTAAPTLAANGNTFTISEDSPEALASALLTIAKAAV